MYLFFSQESVTMSPTMKADISLETRAFPDWLSSLAGLPA